MLDPEQAKYRDLFETLEKEAAAAKSAKSSGRVSSRMVGAGCAAIIAVYGAGYARTQSAADAFTKQLALRRVAAPPLPGIDVKLDRNDIAHPRVETVAVAKERREPAKVKARVDKTESQTPDDAPPEPTAAPAAAPPDVVPPTVAPPPVIERPADPPPPAKSAEAAPAPHWKDGTYTGWGYSRHGNIEAQVVIENGRIAAATISQCRTRYSCSVINALPPQVAQRQSAEVDWVSGATQSADAFYGAVIEALGKAK